MNVGETPDEGELPPLPEFMNITKHHSMSLIEKWSIFRLNPIATKFYSELDNIILRL